MLRRHFPLIIVFLSLLFAAHDYHAGLQSDEVAVCEAENCWQEAEGEGAWLDFADGNHPVQTLFQAPNCTVPEFYFLQTRRSFTPFPGIRLFLQYRQLRTDC